MKEPVALGQWFVMFEGGMARAEKGAEKANINEVDRSVAKAVEKTVAKSVGKVPAASGGGGTDKGKTGTGEAGAVQEL